MELLTTQAHSNSINYDKRSYVELASLQGVRKALHYPTDKQHAIHLAENNSNSAPDHLTLAVHAIQS